jgi:hypothetical protein
MHKYIWRPATWVLAHKLRPGKKYDMHELKIVRDYEDGKVTKEDLDKLSTCDMSAAVNDGLSAASKADAHVFETSEVLAHAEEAVKKAEKKRADNKNASNDLQS